jgi:CBS-domain-containing membrane protein
VQSGAVDEPLKANCDPEDQDRLGDDLSAAARLVSSRISYCPGEPVCMFMKGAPMQASDVMTTNVITVAPTASVQEVAKLLSDSGISAVPVVDEKQRIVGMVSEGDLLHREEIGTERRRSWWLDLAASTDQFAEDYIKTHARTVQDVMTHDVLSVTAETSVSDIALLLENHRIKRVPVIEAGKLVGIVSRANLMRALAMTVNAPITGPNGTDRKIRGKLLTELRSQRWAEASPDNITVKDGIVHLWCSYISDRERRALIVAAEGIPGVRGVEDHMTPVLAGPENRIR